MKKITLKNIHDAIKDISTQFLEQYPENFNIKSFSFGNLSVVNTLEINGAHIHLKPVESVIDGNFTFMNFELYCMDLIDENNIIDVMTSTLEIIISINKLMSSIGFKSKYGFNLNSTVDVVPFNGAFDQDMAGYYGNLTFNVYTGAQCATSFERYYTAEFLKSYVDRTTYTIYGLGVNVLNEGDVIYLSIDGENEKSFTVQREPAYNDDFVSVSIEVTDIENYNKCRIKV